MKFLHQLLSIPALAALLVAALPARAATEPGKPQALTSPDQVPEGLAKSDWSSIRAAYEAGRHAFQPNASGWQARNPGQQWTTQFDKRGFLASPKDGGWQWGLELQSYGFAENPTAISGSPAVQADGQRLSYQWDANVQEWFVNDARGLEHGFTVNQRPASAAASATLDFLLGVRGGLRPQITGDALGVEFLDAAGATVLNYSGLKVWDADGKVLASRFTAAGENQVRLLVDERGARYPLTIDPVAQQAYLKASNTGAGDRFGSSVAVAGDTVVVGAYQEDSSATGVNSASDESAADAGAAYVFVRSGTTWTQQAYLKASQVTYYDVFGYSVAVSGETVVVGARDEDSTSTGVNSAPNDTLGVNGNSGAAYVFVRSGTTWTQQAYLKASQVTTLDQFGISVAVSGDTVVVGAWNEDSSTTGVNSTPNESLGQYGEAGAAYVFVRSAGAWSQQAYLKASNTGADDRFGASVAVAGDTVVVGAILEDSSTTGLNSTSNEFAFNAGAAYVFVRSAGAWTQQAYLKASNTGSGDNFGRSVAVSGDTLVVGAYQEDSSTTGAISTPNEGAPDSGAAYVFTRSGTTWTQLAYFKASNPGANDWFGYSVAVAGDTVVVGALQEDSGTTGVNSTPNETATDSGAAYFFNVIVNTAPQATAQSVSTVQDTAVAITLAGTDADGNPLTYTVAAGPANGSLSGSAPNLSYTPAASYHGNDSFTFTVNDGTENSATATVSIRVNTAHQATAQAVTTAEDTAVAITLTGTNPSGTPLTYAVASGPAAGSLSGTSPNLSYTPSGNYQGSDSFTFTVSDGTADSAPATVSLSVTPVNDAPLATDQSRTTAEDTPLAITLAGTDVDGNPLTYVVITGPANGSLSGSAPNLSYTPALNSSGSDSFTFTVNDGSVTSATATVSLTVTSVNDAPVATAKSVTTVEDTAVAITLTGTDVEGSPLTYAVASNPANGSLSGSPPNLSYTPALNYSGTDSFTFTVNDGSAASATATVTITMTPVNDAPLATAKSVTTPEDTAVAVTLAGTDPDGNPLTYALTSNPVNGSLSGSAPNLTYTPALNSSGSDSFTFTVSDGTLTSATATVSITVTPVNDAPVATAKSLTTAEDTPVAITLAGTDVEGNPLTYAVVTPPANGSLSGTAPNLTYTPALNYNGSDSFTFKVNDGSVDSATATVAITVTSVNDAPLATAKSVTTAEDTPVAITLAGTDAEGSPLTYAVVTGPANGSLSGTAPNLTYTPVLNYNGSDSFTYKVNDGSVDSATATVSITLTPVNDAALVIAQQAYLKASNTGANDLFGTSVAVAGDTVVVGGMYEDSSTPGVNSTPNELSNGSGAAYVFVRSGGAWTQQAYLKAANVGNDNFGCSVAIAGDTLVVGSRYEDSSTTGVNSSPNESAAESGAAYVFVRSGTTWTQQAYLKASNTGAGDQFGGSVAIAGDTLVVGANCEDSSATGVNKASNESAADAGAAYVFTRTGTTWSQQAYLKASNTGADDRFGISVAVAGDTVVVGAANEDSSTTGVNSTPNELTNASGAAYVFTRTGTTWAQQAYLKASNPGAVDQFGTSVAVAGDTVVVGAIREGSSTTGVNSTPNELATRAGAAYVFMRMGTTWTQHAYLKASQVTADDYFGYSVAVSGDTVVVGAWNEDSGTLGVNTTANESGTDSGAAYAFTVKENNAPLATAQSVTTAEDTAVAVTLAGTDADGNPLTYTVATSPAHGTLSGSAPNLTYTPAADYYGSDSFTFTVSDGTVDTSTARVSITVTPVNTAPLATAQAVTTAEDTALAITLAGTDAEGNSLTYAVATGPAHGSLSGSAPNLSYTPAANYYGSDSFTFTVNDGTVDSATATISLTVTPVDDAPLAAAQSTTTAEDTAVAITLAGTDVEGNPLTYAVVTPPANGSLSGTAPNLTYTPALNYHGSDSFTFVVGDGTVFSGPATVSITVTPLNDAPLAAAQSVTTAEDTAVAITLAGTDAEGSPLTYAVVAQPGHGSLSGSARNLTYTPAANYSGSDSFTFTVNDGTVDSATATVSLTVTPVNDAPLAAAQSTTTAEDTAVAITLAGTDAENDALTYTLVAQPTHGSLSGSASNLSYTPTANYYGSDSFTFKVNDGTVDSATATVSITVTPAALTPIETWRNQYFGSPANTGNGADTASAGDGIANLLKYALGIVPGENAASGLPKSKIAVNGGDRYLALTFKRDPARNDVTIIVQASDNLSGWTEVARCANGGSFTGSATVTETENPDGTRNVEVRDVQAVAGVPRRFMRVSVNRPE